MRFFQGSRCNNNIRLDGQVAVITGGNTGIGKETAKDLSQRGAAVVIACRDVNKAESAAREISSETKNPVTVLQLDLASMSSIKSAASILKIQQPKIHLLINNAGVMLTPQWKTEDGFEMQFGVNHLGHFLWTSLLLENVKNASPARIINVSSIAHTKGRIHFDDIMMENNYDPFKSYCQSKLANVLFSRELAKRLEGTGVSVYSLHPGAVETELSRHLKNTTPAVIHKLFYFSEQYFFKTPEMGAQTTIYCATEPSIANVTGRYYDDCEEKRPSRQAQDNEAAIRLWELSETLLQLR